MTTTTPPTSTSPRLPMLPREHAMELARVEYDRVVRAVSEITADDWAKPTDCPEWDVRQLACHLAGMFAMASDPAETARQREVAAPEHARRGGAMIDSMTAIQVRERATLSPEQVVAEVRRRAPEAAQARTHTPAAVRDRVLPDTYRLNGVEEEWSVGYLVDVVLTRDCWMHRVDLARATASEPELTEAHDGPIVDDVVREWAARHGRPYHLELTGPAGGQWSSDLPGEPESIRMDAIEFCRTLSGRETGVGLLGTAVPF